MRRIKWLVVAVAVTSLSAGAAVAASRSSETTPVTADFQASLTSQKQRPCGENHMQFRLTFEGTQTSGDARLAGDLEAKVRSVVNTQNGYGSTSGTVVVRDPATGRAKFFGRVIGVLEPGGGAEGFLIGTTVGRGSARLLANFNLQQDAAGAITGEFGKDSQSGALQDPAILTDACRNGHESHESHERNHHARPPAS
jgi:hypothetical protein